MIKKNVTAKVLRKENNIQEELNSLRMENSLMSEACFEHPMLIL